jgi:prepilin-type N-terminal cleavage/methylation domain-containing protein
MLKVNRFRPRPISLLLKYCRRKSPPEGYTLIELLVVTVVIGILSGVVVSAKPWYENPLKNSQDRLNSAIKLARTRAMTSTSTYRITADPDNPNEAIRVQRIRSSSCNANTTLAQDVAAGDTTITVNDTSGFAIGDRLRVAGTLADALAVNFDSNTITLGAPVGEKTTGARVATVKNWKNDGAFLAEDLNVNQKRSSTDPDIRLVAKVNNTETSDWIICINTRGLVSLSDNGRMITNQNLDLVLKNARTNEEAGIRIAPGGAIETTAIAN